MPSLSTRLLEQPTLHGSSTDPRPDFIIVFDTTASVPSPPKPVNGPQSEKTEIELKDKSEAVQKQVQLQDEYASLLGVLEEAGLDVVGRSGGKGTGQILIFVRATEARVQAEVHRERLSDWLHGVKSTKPSPRQPRDFSADPVTPAERLRHVRSIISAPRSSTSVSVTSSASSGRTAGLTPIPSPRSFPHVTAIFPPHDPQFNKRWLDRWMSSSHFRLSIPPEELVEIKDHLGEKIALYFAFLQYYFISLAFPAGLGSIFWLCGLTYSPYYSAALCAWSVVFVERWRIKERELAVEWGTYGVHEVETQRAEFVGSSQIVDPVSGVQKDYFPFARTLLRQLASVPVLLGFVGVLSILISIIYSIETIVGEVYDGPGKRFATLIPTVLFVGVVPQVTALWQATASRLTSWENHPRQSEHDKSLTLKVFALNFFVAFGSLILTSYVYIPFGSILVPHILSLLPSKHAARVSKTSPDKMMYAINATKLHTQIVAYTLTNQIVGAVIELAVPMLTRLVKEEVAHVQDKRSKSRSNSPPPEADEEDEKTFLERVRLEVTLPEYNTFADYAEMATQFGYATLWTTIWPVAPLFSFLNNFFELRGDAFKITTQHRRPVPVRETSIGPWLEAMGAMTWLAAITNASLVYLYREHLSHPSPTADYLSDLAHNVTGHAPNITVPQNATVFFTSSMHLASHSPDPVGSVKSTLWRALLIALATEHAYLIFRATVRFCLNHLLWHDCKAEQAIRRSAMDLKRGYLEEMGLRKGPADLAKESGATGKAEEKDKLKREIEEKGLPGFWRRGDRGLEAVRRMGKTMKTE